MRRTDRLFEILQLFRDGRPLLGQEIADKLGVSLRTIYRDIDTLVASGFPIEGERGVGYILREPIFLPPLALAFEELQAFHLGMEVVLQTGDREIAQAAQKLVSKIRVVTPQQRLQPIRNISVYISEVAAPPEYLALIRQAILWSERLLRSHITV